MAFLDKLLGRNTMSETLTKIIVDCSTNEVTEVPLTAEEIAQQKGTPTVPGTGNAYRNRSIEENKALFEAMKAGQFKDGEKVLRAKNL